MSHALQQIQEENEKLGVRVEEIKTQGSGQENEKIRQSTDLAAVHSHQGAQIKQEAHPKGRKHSEHPIVYGLSLTTEKLMSSLTSTQ